MKRVREGERMRERVRRRNREIEKYTIYIYRERKTARKSKKRATEEKGKREKRE